MKKHFLFGLTVGILVTCIFFLVIKQDERGLDMLACKPAKKWQSSGLILRLDKEKCVAFVDNSIWRQMDKEQKLLTSKDLYNCCFYDTLNSSWGEPIGLNVKFYDNETGKKLGYDDKDYFTAE